MNEFLEPENAELRKALNLSATGQVVRALELIEASLMWRPQSAPAYRAKAMVLSVADRYQEAVEAMRTAVVHSNSRDPAYFVELGEYLIEIAQFEDAYAALTDAIELIRATGELPYLQTALLARAVAAIKGGVGDLIRDDLKFLDQEARLYCAGDLWSKQKVLKVLAKPGKHRS